MASKTSRISGEFDLIKKIQAMMTSDDSVVVGIGDDTAVLRQSSPGKEWLFTTDMILQNRHFKLEESTAFEIGWKALAVNISDIAAMGGVPAHAVVALGLPKETSLDFVRELYEGIRALAKLFHVNIVGGDTNRSNALVVSVALLGWVEKGRALRRCGARAGDIIAVSGSLGGSYRSKKHLRFMPRVREARYLAKHYKISAMMDISDGLASDLFHLTEASQVGAVLDEQCLPRARGVSSTEEALSQGEDFELLYTLPLSQARRLWRSSVNRKSRIFYPIGWVTKKAGGVRLATVRGLEPLVRQGYDHFR